MKKILPFVLTIFTLSAFISSCQKSSPPTAGAVEQNNNPVNFINILNVTDSGTVVPSAITKTGYTAIIQQNFTKDSSAIDSIKFRYKSPTKLVDSLILVSPTVAASKIVTPYSGLIAQYYTFTVASDSLVTGTTYSIVATVYTADGNSATTTFASLFKW
jgi:hypothetical protein